MQSINYETQYQSLLEEFKQSISDPSKGKLKLSKMQCIF